MRTIKAVYDLSASRADRPRMRLAFCGRLDSAHGLTELERRGVQAIGDISGDFAIVGWDPDAHQAVAARDLMGTQPLYWAMSGVRFAAASDAVEVLSCLGMSPRANLSTLTAHLVDLSPLGDQTIFEGVQSVPPGSSVLASAYGVEAHAFAAPRIDLTRPRSLADSVADLRDLLAQAVRRRIADAGDMVAVLMSGGLDSTSVCALARRERSPESLRLFAVSCASERLRSCNEREVSECVAATLDAQLDVVPIDERLLLDDDCRFRPSLETPFMTWETALHDGLSRMGAAGARIALTGMSGPYSRVQFSQLTLADQLRRGQIVALRDLGAHVRKTGLSWPQILRSRVVAPLMPLALRRVAWRGRIAELLPPWVRLDSAQRVGVVDRLEAAREEWSVRRSLDDVSITPPPCILRAVHWLERASREHGVTVRHPLLDREVVEFLRSTPPEMMYGKAADRSLFREAMAGILPDVARNRPPATDFTPYDHTCLAGNAAQLVRRLFARPLLADLGIIEPSVLLREHELMVSSGKLDLVPPLWDALCAEMWLQAHCRSLGIVV